MAGARAGGDDAFAFSPSFHPRGLKPSLLWYISCQAGRGRSPPWAPASLPRVGVPGLATALGSCRGTCGPKPRPRSPPPVQFSELLLAVWERLLGFALVRGSRAGAADPPVGPEQRHGSAGREEGERPPAVTRTSRPGRDTKQAQVGKGRGRIPAEPGPAESHTWQLPPELEATLSETPQRGNAYSFILKNLREEAVTVRGRNGGPICQSPPPLRGRQAPSASPWHLVSHPGPSRLPSLLSKSPPRWEAGRWATTLTSGSASRWRRQRVWGCRS